MNWDDLFVFQKSFRAARGISGASLLRRLRLSPNSLKYLYSKKVQPSTKGGSIGLELREALQQLMNSRDQQDIIARNSDDSSLAEKVNDVLLNEENKQKLFEANILDVVVTDEDSNSVHVVCSGQYDEGKVVQTLHELTSALRLQINSFEAAHQLGYYESPLCVTSDAKGALNGTGCIVHNETGIFGVTAKHVLLGFADDTELLPRALVAEEEEKIFNVSARLFSSRNSISSRYDNDGDIQKIGWFTKKDLHSDEDIAKFHVSPEHGFAVNKLFGERSFVFAQSVMERKVIHVGEKVCKVGAASGTTFGKIESFTAGATWFYVIPTEVGVFATPGDSGALVVTEDNIAVGMVVRGTLKKVMCLNICMIFGAETE